ncbi:MAG TPA: hypothetical protein VI819_03805 [Patescibacteria group bacterium]|nr:hypothetical protein [Patescibacteria group bacterium]
MIDNKEKIGVAYKGNVGMVYPQGEFVQGIIDDCPPNSQLVLFPRSFDSPILIVDRRLRTLEWMIDCKAGKSTSKQFPKVFSNPAEVEVVEKGLITKISLTDPQHSLDNSDKKKILSIGSDEKVNCPKINFYSTAFFVEVGRCDYAFIARRK